MIGMILSFIGGPCPVIGRCDRRRCSSVDKGDARRTASTDRRDRLQDDRRRLAGRHRSGRRSHDRELRGVGERRGPRQRCGPIVSHPERAIVGRRRDASDDPEVDRVGLEHETSGIAAGAVRRVGLATREPGDDGAQDERRDGAHG